MRQTLGTGMMAPLSMANNFHGNYYAGPSGAAIGALGISKALSDGLMNLRARQDYNAQQAQLQAERDSARMEDMNQRQAVAQALNPYKAAESSGMGNRDMARRQALPDAQTQMALYKVKQDQEQKKAAERNKQLTSLATLWYTNGGEKTDPGGVNFQRMTGGYSPYEYIQPSTMTAMANLDLRRDLADESRQTRIALANLGRGGAPTSTDAPKGPEYLPLDMSGRRALSEWMTQASDAARVASMMNDAMGATVNPQTGEVEYQEQPNGMFSGGTGLVLGSLPDKIAARVDPDGVQLRAVLSNFSSQIMNALSGAAVSEQEKKRLEAFLPTSSDKWATLREKINGYRSYLAEKGNAWEMTYGPHDVLNRGLGLLNGPAKSGQTRGKVGPKVGTVVDGYEYLGGDPNDQESWRPTNGK